MATAIDIGSADLRDALSDLKEGAHKRLLNAADRIRDNAQSGNTTVIASWLEAARIALESYNHYDALYKQTLIDQRDDIPF